MARNGFKVALKVGKTVHRELKKAAREQERLERRRELEARKEQRAHEAQILREQREQEKQRILDEKLTRQLAAATEKERVKAEIAEAKAAYASRCEKRKYVREQIINRELK